jgi:putative transposase
MGTSRVFDRFRRILKGLDLVPLARATGFQRRAPRKLTPRIFVWSVILGAMHGPVRGLADLARAAASFGATGLSRQGFHQRLTEGAAGLLRTVAERLGGALAASPPPALPGALARFADVTVVDTTLVGLVDRLARQFPGCRTKTQPAGVKLHARVSLTRGDVEALRLSGERLGDRRGDGFGPWVRDRLVLFDLAYFDYQLFQQIVAAGGAFLTRLKSTANGTIVTVRQGAARAAEGHGLAETPVTGDVVDLDVAYGRGRGLGVLRTVGLWNPAARAYHWYVTSLAPAAWPAAGLGPLYALRWQIELVFKSWKSLCHLTDQPSGHPAIVAVLLAASLCFALLARLALVLARDRFGLDWHRLSPALALKLLRAHAFALGTALARGSPRRRALFDRLLEDLALYAHTPNRTNALCTFTR